MLPDPTKFGSDIVVKPKHLGFDMVVVVVVVVVAAVVIISVVVIVVVVIHYYYYYDYSSKIGSDIFVRSK
jgi:hypothetical protein